MEENNNLINNLSLSNNTNNKHNNNNNNNSYKYKQIRREQDHHNLWTRIMEALTGVPLQVFLKTWVTVHYFHLTLEVTNEHSHQSSQSKEIDSKHCALW
jgi:hypothetical protein